MVNTTVFAKSVDKVHIRFECPFCWSKYKKNGEPTKNAKKVIHLHGSCGELHNRIEHRGAHCINNKYNGSFNIIINDDTARL